MPIRHAIWRVAANPEPLRETQLASERLLEEMIEADPRLISEERMLIGRQEDTGHGGRIDLLAVAPDGALVLMEHRLQADDAKVALDRREAQGTIP